MTRRYPENRRQNQERFDLLGRARREPDDWAGGDRRKGGVKPTQALVRNCGNQSLRCQGGSPSGDNHEARVPMRSTAIRRSDEGAVMGPEQRDRIRWLPSRDNWKQEDAMKATDKPFSEERRVYLMGAV